MRISDIILKKNKQRNVLDIFKEVFKIYKSLSWQVLVLFLSSGIIFIGDPLHTVVIEQHKNKEDISLSKAFSRAKRYINDYMWVSTLFGLIDIVYIVSTGFLVAFLFLILKKYNSWLFLMLYFIIFIILVVKLFYSFFYLSMVSNVVILENKTGVKAMRRCRQLVRQNRDTEAVCASYLLGIPFVAAAFWVFISYLFEKAGFFSSDILIIPYIIITFILVVITFSILELGNTLLYYELIDREEKVNG